MIPVAVVVTIRFHDGKELGLATVHRHSSGKVMVSHSPPRATVPASVQLVVDRAMEFVMAFDDGRAI